MIAVLANMEEIHSIAEARVSNLNISDVTIKDFKLSTACCARGQTILVKLLIYNLPHTPSYHVLYQDTSFV